MIVTNFHIEVQMQDNFDEARVSIGLDRQPKDEKEEEQIYAAAMAAAENMMAMWASSSKKGFEEALKTLCEGARAAKVLRNRGQTIN